MGGDNGNITGGKTISTGFNTTILSSGRGLKFVGRSYGLEREVFFINVGTKGLVAGLLGFLTCEEEPTGTALFCRREIFVVAVCDRFAFALVSRFRNSAIFI